MPLPPPSKLTVEEALEKDEKNRVEIAAAPSFLAVLPAAAPPAANVCDLIPCMSKFHLACIFRRMKSTY